MNIRKALGLLPPHFHIEEHNGFFWLYQYGYRTGHASKDKSYIKGVAWVLHKRHKNKK